MDTVEDQQKAPSLPGDLRIVGGQRALRPGDKAGTIVVTISGDSVEAVAADEALNWAFHELQWMFPERLSLYTNVETAGGFLRLTADDKPVAVDEKPARFGQTLVLSKGINPYVNVGFGGRG